MVGAACCAAEPLQRWSTVRNVLYCVTTCCTMVLCCAACCSVWARLNLLAALEDLVDCFDLSTAARLNPPNHLCPSAVRPFGHHEERLSLQDIAHPNVLKGVRGTADKHPPPPTRPHRVRNHTPARPSHPARLSHSARDLIHSTETASRRTFLRRPRTEHGGELFE